MKVQLCDIESNNNFLNLKFPAVFRTGLDRFYIAAGGGSSNRDKAHIMNVIDDKGFNCTLVGKAFKQR